MSCISIGQAREELTFSCTSSSFTLAISYYDRVAIENNSVDYLNLDTNVL